MPRIRDDVLKHSANRWLLARQAELVVDVLRRLREAGGDFDWHLVVDCGGGEWRIIRFSGLAAQMVGHPDSRPATLADAEIPAAHVVDRNKIGTGAAVALARKQPESVLLVLEDGQPAGVIFEGAALGADALPGDLQSLIDHLAGPEGLEQANGGGDVDEGEMSFHVPAGEAQRPFAAQPWVDAPAQVPPETPFKVEIGLSERADPALTGVMPVHIDHAPPDAFFTVALLTDGARVTEGEQHRKLPLDTHTRLTFTCQPQPGTSQVRLTALYFYRAQLAGMATRSVAVGPDAPLAPRRSDPCRLAQVSPATLTDLQVTISRSRVRPGYLQWTFIAPRPALAWGPVLTVLSDAREFAALLLQELKTQEYGGLFASQVLANKAQDIADVMPGQFFEALHAVHQAVGRTPSVLLLTDETYVPWELALLDPPLDPNAPPYLGAQADIGRWLLHERVLFPPPVALTIRHVTAVAAEFGLGTNLTQLKHALDEQKMLGTLLDAQPLEARREALQGLVEQPRPGHLLHFAVHGLSDPEGNDQALLLADKTRLIPSALAGRYRCDEPPNFDFVFLNACQVGTAATCLGQAAGFPGDLIRGGTRGFVAPLWDVHDGQARALAERFYTEAFHNQRPVAALLREERCRYDRRGHTTPLAYVFYGHPKLVLERGS